MIARLSLLLAGLALFFGAQGVAQAAPPVGWTVVTSGTCAHGGIYAEASVWGDLMSRANACPSSGTFNCATDVDWSWFGSALTGQLCAIDPTDAAAGSGSGGGSGGGASAPAFDLGNPAHAVQALIAVILAGLGFHGYSVGCRE